MSGQFPAPSGLGHRGLAKLGQWLVDGFGKDRQTMHDHLKARIADLEAENARLQERVEEEHGRYVHAVIKLEHDRDGYKARAERRGEALRHIFVTAEERRGVFPADGYWQSVRDTAALAIAARLKMEPMTRRWHYT